ncbi:MAG: excinuclease ABC subunit UvrA [Kiritimatiellae bacterium]|nr:excinuclease ABC subunit UvrA [Kiritimatiellia bacterium]
MANITITNAKVHNLKGVNVTIPRNALTVVTGLSGSGKSSLAFDTLYAEGQRRYVESLSAYARQFLDRLQKPDVERIEGLSPAIAIEQRTTGGNPRSIVATVTEIHDYLRILYASAGVAHCPKCGKPVRRQSAEEIVEAILALPSGKTILYAPVVKGRKGRHEDTLASIRRAGFVRVRVDGTTYPLDEVPELDKKRNHDIEVVVDRLVLPESNGKKGRAGHDPAFVTRLTDSVELGLKTGSGLLLVARLGAGGKDEELVFSEKNACPDCGLSFDELKPRSFSFNSPFGACPNCGGLGSIYYFDEDLVVPDKTLPLRECIHPWRRAGHMAIMYYNEILARIAKQYKVDLNTPYEKLPAKFRHQLMHGFDDDLVLPWRKEDKPFEGVLATVQRMMENAESDERREKFEAYQSNRPCPACHGSRLRPESRAVTVGNKTIVEAMAMSVRDALAFFRTLHDEVLASCAAVESGAAPTSTIPLPMKDILGEIVKRLGFLNDVGLDYLSLDRASSSLSGGEMQRIRLATQIGSGLTGVLYVLDEPTIGLHPRDNERLIKMLRALSERDNTVVVVEHDAEMMKAADWIVDLGPGAGREGGQIMYQGDYRGLMKAKTLTADYLTGRKVIDGGRELKGGKGHKASDQKWLTISGCREHNLKNITVRIPLGSFTVVTGVSGSGKSSLIDETLKCELMRRFYHAKEAPGAFKKLTGDEYLDKVIEIDQSPIGRTPRSNPATYVGFFSEIRELFAQTEGAKARGYGPGRFSFNVKGGRCETCGGDGVVKLEMSFLPDAYVTCDQCGGKRFNKETLEVRYGGKNIAEVLDMTVAEACDFFAKVPRLAAKLKTLKDVGLGYLGLGQSATTLSGGEAQRIKLATELSRRSTGKTLFLLDEPTTGLHFDDVAKLMTLLLKLRDAGNTVVVIEHNVDVMKCADWIIDLGPGGGDAGGNLVVEGTVEQVRKCPTSFTGRFL